jgi:alpha-tubulin suppressor-like RCC1 family protein
LSATARQSSISLALLAALGGCLDLDSLDRCSRQQCAPTPTCAAQITGGWSHTCARKADGTVWCWGNNNADQLGLTDGGLAMRPVPEPVAGLSGAVSIAAGDSHSCAVTDAGAVFCWGYNSNGQLGQSTSGATSAVPLKVQSLTGAATVSAGLSHSCATKSDGTVWCWGANDHGQLGIDAGADSVQPVKAQLLAGVSQVALGYNHGCALKGDGTVWCWGANGNGQLGDGTNADRSTPDVPVAISEVAAIGAGYFHSCAVKRDGTVWCWGMGGRGELGNDDTADQWTPVQARGVTGAVQVSLNAYEKIGPLAHTCARGATGATWCWGDNTFGQLGDGTTMQRNTPTPVPSVPDAVDLGVGAKVSCVIRLNGTVWCWGANEAGELGDLSYLERHQPVGTALPCP